MNIQPGGIPLQSKDSASSESAEISSLPVFLGHLISDLQSSPKKEIAETEGASHGSRRRSADLSKTESVKSKKVCDYTIATSDANVSRPDTKSSSDYDHDCFVLRDHFAALRTITVPHVHFPKSLSNAPLAEQLAEKTIHWLQLSNTPYNERDSVVTRYYGPSRKPTREFECELLFEHERLETRKKLGAFYCQDYQAHELPNLIQSSRLGQHSLPNYFDRVTTLYSFVAKGNGHTPSECLDAFFHGPTIADCASALLACQYRAFETIIGTDEFNRIFDTPVSRFRIACNLFHDDSVNPECMPISFESLKPIDYINPLYKLFGDLQFMRQSSSDPVAEKLTESDIKKGDILYIWGVESYNAKHKIGPSAGFNLICTGQNSSGHNLYLGFCPEKFDEPKTYDQVKKILIDGYNKPQSPETTSAIKEGKTSYAQWADHTLPYDHPIVGITVALRFCKFRWQYYSSLYDKAWHQQPLLPVAPVLESRPVDHGSPFPSENLVADFDHFESGSSQQELMKLTALKFTHAVINNLDETQHKKPMGLFLTGSPGLGKTYLCVAVAKKAADYGVKTLYIDAEKVGSLINDFAGDKAQWNKEIDEMLAGKELVVLDDANHEFGCTQIFLAKTMTHVMTANAAVMVSSNHPISVKDLTPGFVDPLTKDAHNFFYLSDLQGESHRPRWWHSPEIQVADALSQLGQYQGCKAAGAIIEDVVSTDDIAKILSIPVGQIRQVGHYFLPGIQRYSPDFFFSDLSKTEHQAVFMECHITGDESHYCCDKIEQFLNVIQRVHDEGLKLVIRTNNCRQFLETVRGCLSKDISLRKDKIRIIDRLKHMFPDFS